MNRLTDIRSTDTSSGYTLGLRSVLGGGATVMTKHEEKTSVLPTLTPIPGLVIRNILDLVVEKDRQQLQRDLDEIARVRRQAEATSGSLQLG